MSSDKATQPEYRVHFKDPARDEFKRLDGSVKKMVAAQLLKIEANPYSGEPLGKKMGIDLTGYRKLYVDGTRLRIVWEVRPAEALSVVWAIGKRDKGEVYRLVAERLK